MGHVKSLPMRQQTLTKSDRGTAWLAFSKLPTTGARLSYQHRPASSLPNAVNVLTPRAHLHPAKMSRHQVPESIKPPIGPQPQLGSGCWKISRLRETVRPEWVVWTEWAVPSRPKVPSHAPSSPTTPFTKGNHSR